MNLDIVLAFGSAALGGAMAVGGMVRARNLADRWTFVGGMAVLATERVISGLLAGATTEAEIIHWEIWRLTAASLIPGLWLLFSLSYARGNAREFLLRWRLPLAGAFLLPVGLAVLFRERFFLPSQPGEPAGLFRLGLAGYALELMMLVSAVLVLMNLERTFRASIGVARWRIKFILLGVGVLFIVRLYTVSQAVLFRGEYPSLDNLNSVALIAGCLLILRSLFRSRRFGLDVYPSHSVLQGSVTILLVGIYLLAVGVFSKVVGYLGGTSDMAHKTLVVLLLLVFLSILLQSDQVQLHLRRMVSRHFQRPLYDYRTIWRKFTEETSSRVEQPDFCRAVVKLLAEIFQTMSVTLWVFDERHEEFILAGSTSLAESQARELKPVATEAAAIIHHLREHPEPVDIEEVKDDWAATLRRCHPDQFRKGGTRVCVPVTAGDEVLAVILLGDRVGGVAFTLQDFDLLKSLGDQVASSLLNVRLSQRLLQAREHEAFQAMAAFFVHDLKNAASTLNLLLQNLPVHFDDPAFREDALRGVGKSVTHINHLISRLSQLRHELKIQPTESDLNSVLAGVLGGFEPDTAFEIERRLVPVSKLSLDRDQFAKVVTNLVLNARESTAGEGRLTIATGQMGPWIVLTMTDNGCGMSAEFLKNSLFRPFQTTKKNGLGIGMFQSKMIVEAHRGRITVESTPGQGTTFRVFLPIPPPHR